MTTIAQKIICLIAILTLVATVGLASNGRQAGRPWYEKDEITIVVTDSGLGGLSVLAELERRLREARTFRRVHLVFFNALFTATGGYNALSSREDKIRTFDRVLHSIDERYEPDEILVACNTLSVLVDDTSFISESSVPVRSIVEPGVALIERALRGSPDLRVLLFATRTTVEEDSHRRAIAARGLDPDRVIAQSCPELAASIEEGFDSEDTRLLIETFVFEAVDKIGRTGTPVELSLNCSHYPYAWELWEAALEEYDLDDSPILDPNSAMVDAFLDVPLGQRFPATEIVVSVVSKVEISENRRQSIARAVRAVSNATAEALMKYRWIPDLFE